MQSLVAVALVSLALTAFATHGASSQEAERLPDPAPRTSSESAPVSDAPGESEARLDGLTDKEREILARGEYDRGEIVGGGLLGTFIGLGSGHVVQGRYGERGWIFTAGELGSFAAMVGGVAICAAADDDDDDDDDWDAGLGSAGCWYGVIVGSFAAWVGFKTWEIVDIWAVPAVHNKRYRKLKTRTEDSTDGPKVSFQLTPRLEGGATAGLAVRF